MGAQQKVLLTFDYELFQGQRSGSVQRCMLQPTDRILEILKRHRAKAIFFVDMLYVCRLKGATITSAAAKGDFEKIESQLVRAAEEGHYIFNHLHPHWLDAQYNEARNEWTLTDDSKYCFESLTETDRARVFEMTMGLLNEILGKASKKHAPEGYRAGGLYIQPFSSFKKYFDQYGIRSDFSVLRNATGKLEHGNFGFDFSTVTKNVYRFANDITQNDPNGSYTEYAMKFVDIPFVYRIMNSLHYRLFAKSESYKRYGDGVSTSNKISMSQKKALASTETFAVEMLNAVKMPLYLKEAQQNGYLHLLSHPKLVSDYNLQVFDKLLSKLGKNNVEFDFKKFEVQ
jgi:peptidoglycan/xylan/chitin deacetylase (PgdA/CDA1 family)